MDRTPNKSVFRVAGMDCAAEEALVRMALDTFAEVKSIEFDLSGRTVSVYHLGTADAIESALSRLDLGSTRIETIESGTHPSNAPNLRRLLWTVLLINLGFFAIESAAGVISNSMSLIADSLDMLADALVYGMSLLAVGATAASKKAVAKSSGYFQSALALIGFIEVLRRFLGYEVLPDYRVMIGVSVLALIANLICLMLLQRSKSQEIHIQASVIFTSNDIVINLGVIAAGVLVMWLDYGLPDLVVGAVVFLIVMRGAWRLLNLAK